MEDVFSWRFLLLGDVEPFGSYAVQFRFTSIRQSTYLFVFFLFLFSLHSSNDRDVHVSY